MELNVAVGSVFSAPAKVDVSKKFCKEVKDFPPD
jgi:hypothetical protein